MAREITLEDDKFNYGRIGYYRIIGAAATATANTATDGTNYFALDVGQFTGKKSIAISQTTGVAGSISYVTYGAYNPLMTQAEFIAYMDATADTEFIYAVASGSGAVDSGGTQQAQIETTVPYKWLGVTVVGNTFTYNLEFSGC